MTDPHVAYVAHHMLLLAIPAFLPAVIVVAVVLYAALKDRRAGDGDDEPDSFEAPRGAPNEKRD
jgi:hypothetical protein